jgi:hypothetical protein
VITFEPTSRGTDGTLQFVVPLEKPLVVLLSGQVTAQVTAVTPRLSDEVPPSVSTDLADV